MTSKPLDPTTKASKAGKTAWRERDWETLFVVAVFVIALLATVWMILISISDSDPDNKFRIVPAASLMLMIEAWLIFTLPFYGKLAFWGAVISIATYLFFAVPFVGMGLLSGGFAIGIGLFIVVSMLCLLLLFRQRERFFRLATGARK